MEQRLSGGTINLLRIARSGCRSASSFVALAQPAGSFASLVYPASPEPGALDESAVNCLIRQLWDDPGLGRGKAVVRTVDIGGDRLAVVAVPIARNEQGQLSGIVGAADPSGRAFGLPELELLSRIARRLTSYVQARRVVRNRLIRAAQPAPEPITEAVPEPEPDRQPDRQEGSLRALLGDEEEIDGLVPLGSLLGRAGRLLGAGASTSGALAVVAVEIEGVPAPSSARVAEVVRSIRMGLRFDDPVARVGELSFVAVVPLAPGGATAGRVEDHVRAQAREAVAGTAGARVHAAHAVAPLNGGQDADELLRAAVVKLRAD